MTPKRMFINHYITARNLATSPYPPYFCVTDYRLRSTSRPDRRLKFSMQLYLSKNNWFLISENFKCPSNESGSGLSFLSIHVGDRALPSKLEGWTQSFSEKAWKKITVNGKINCESLMTFFRAFFFLFFLLCALLRGSQKALCIHFLTF